MFLGGGYATTTPAIGQLTRTVASGAAENATVTGLPIGVSIYFAERGTDSAGNIALIARTVLAAD